LNPASSAVVTFLDAEDFPIFNDLRPELSGRESDELEAGMESDEVEAGREINEAAPGCTWDTSFPIAENFCLLGEGDGEGDGMRVPSLLPSSPLIPMRCMG
jgi:hypothetical protein